MAALKGSKLDELKWSQAMKECELARKDEDLKAAVKGSWQRAAHLAHAKRR